MKKRYWILLALTLLIAGLFIFVKSGENHLSAIGRELGLDLSGGRIVAHKDSHGGFHGDGVSVTSIQFSAGELHSSIQRAPGWHRFPLNETVQALLYGHEFEDGIYGPYLTDGEGSPLLPEIEHGYYWLRDRQDGKGAAAKADILHRNSLNITVAVYDSNAGILYYCKMDT